MVGFVPVVVTASSADIDPVTIERHVDAIARSPHPMGSVPNDTVSRYVMSALRINGLEPQRQEFTAQDYFGGLDETVVATNVMARIEGIDHERALALVAHYDSVPSTVGANDDAAAVGALLEVSRVLARTTPPNDVIVLFTDGEEPSPRFGAEAFTDHPWFPDVALVANFEAIGSAGPPLLVETSGPRGHLLAHLTASASDAVAFSILTDVSDLVGEVGTDLDVFRAHGVPGYNFAYLGGSSVYHTPRDDLASLNRSGAAGHASIALGLAMAPIPSWGDASRADDAVFFSLPGGVMVRFGVPMALVLVVVTVLTATATAAYRVRRSSTTVRDLIVSSGVTAGGMVLAGIVGALLWTSISVFRPTMGAAEEYLWLAALAVIAAAVARLVNRVGRDHVTGIIIVWAGLTALSAIALPGLATILAIPVIAACAALLYAEVAPGAIHSVVRVTAVSLVTGVLVMPAIDIFLHLAAPRPGNPDSELPATIALPVMLSFLAVGLIGTTIPSTRRHERHTNGDGIVSMPTVGGP
jgi:Peptidase family M28